MSLQDSPMHKKHYSLLARSLGAVGLAMLLNGCGGSSFEQTTYGTYQNALPAAYGIEATAANGNISGPIGGPFFYETSGLGSADGRTAYFAAASGFAIVKNPNNATLLAGVDPNLTGTVPLGFSGTTGTADTAGQYIDANTSSTPAIPSAITPGASVVFRAALSNGISQSARSTIPITYNGVSLSSTDPEWTLGTLPLTFNYIKTGPFANATYVTGTPVSSGQGTPTSFALPFTTAGVHTVVLTVSDDAGQQTATTFEIPVVDSSSVALVLQNFIVAAPTTNNPAAVSANSITPNNSVTIDGGAGTGSYPDGFKPTIADAQGTVILFTTPGTHTITETDTTGKQVQTASITIAPGTGGMTIVDVPLTGTTISPPPAASAQPRVFAAARTIKR
jgi:hypothetical protein